uniref:Uncharacterized protein n=1 Tax=Arundo donax TaxID=35708 RepID=A0A0A9HJU8_ARUDO
MEKYLWSQAYLHSFVLYNIVLKNCNNGNLASSYLMLTASCFLTACHLIFFQGCIVYAEKFI